jgi:hypothetical protein
MKFHLLPVFAVLLLLLPAFSVDDSGKSGLRHKPRKITTTTYDAVTNSKGEAFRTSRTDSVIELYNEKRYITERHRFWKGTTAVVTKMSYISDTLIRTASARFKNQLRDSTVYTYKGGLLAEETVIYPDGNKFRTLYTHQGGLPVKVTELNEKGTMQGKRVYTYYPNKKLKQEKYFESPGSEPTGAWSYEYDSLGRKQKEYATTNTGSVAISGFFHYNEQGDCDSSFTTYEHLQYSKTPIYSVYRYTYVYDEKNNWVQQVCTKVETDAKGNPVNRVFVQYILIRTIEYY